MKHRPLRLVAVLLAIIIGTGFASAAAVFSSTSGAAIEKSIAKPLTHADVVVRPKTGSGQQNIEKPANVAATIAKLPGITAAAPLTSIFLDLANGTELRAVVDPGPQLRIESLRAGAWPASSEQIVLGERTASSAAVLLSPKENL